MADREDEIDLLEIKERLNEYAFFRSSFFALLKLKNNLLIILIVGIIAAVVGFFWEKNKKPTFLTSLIIKTSYENVPLISDSLNAMLSTNQLHYYDGSEMETSVSTEIKKLRYVTTINSFHELYKVKLEKFNYPREFIEWITEGKVTLIVLHLDEKEKVEPLHQAILSFYEKVPFLNEVQENDIELVNKRIKTLREELSTLDSLKLLAQGKLNHADLAEIIRTRLETKLKIIDQNRLLQNLQTIELYNSTPIVQVSPNYRSSSLKGFCLGFAFACLLVMVFAKSSKKA